MALDLRNVAWRLLLLANLLVASLSALFWVALWVVPTVFSQHPTDESPVAFAVRGNTPAELAALFGSVLLVGNVLYLVYGLRPKTPSQHVISETRDGPVKISREALESGLRTAGEKLDEVSRLRVTIDTERKRSVVVVRAQFQAPEGVHVQHASKNVRQAVLRRFDELVKLPDGRRVELDIEFLGFAGKLLKKPPPADPPKEEQPTSFTGPKYPIDDEDPFGARGNS